MKKLIYYILKSLLARLPDEDLRNLLVKVASTRARSLSPADGLRFLFALDAAFYPLEGGLAVDYEGGVHTKHRHTHYHDFFVQRVNKGEKILDIGCGIGALSFDIAEKTGALVLGVDLNSENIAIARERYSHPNVVYHVGNLFEMTLDDHFDAVILSNVLEHIPDRSQFLRRVIQVAWPARILLRVPIFERDWRVPLKQELGLDYRLDPTHETEYTIEDFAAEINEAGLRIVHQEVRWGEIWAEAEPSEAPMDHPAEIRTE